MAGPAPNVPQVHTPVPNPSQGRVAFNTNVQGFVDSLVATINGMNVATTYMETTAGEAETNANTSTTKADEASASATAAAQTLTDVNNAAAQIVTDATNAAVAGSAQNSADAQAAADAAAATANFQGAWAVATGSASQGQSYSHNGAVWVLVNSLADITTQEPAFGNPNWTPATFVTPANTRYDMLIAGADGTLQRLAGVDGDGQYVLTIKNGSPTLEAIVPNLVETISPRPAQIEKYSTIVPKVISGNRWPGLNGQAILIQSTSITIANPDATTLATITSSSAIAGANSRIVSCIPSHIDDVYYALMQNNDNYGIFSIAPATGAVTTIANKAKASFNYPVILDAVNNRYTFLRQELDGKLYIESNDDAPVRFEISKTNGDFVANDPTYSNPAIGSDWPGGQPPLHSRPTSNGDYSVLWGYANSQATPDVSYLYAVARDGEDASDAGRTALRGDTDTNVSGYISGRNGWPTGSVNGTALGNSVTSGDCVLFIPWYPGTYLPIVFDVSSASGIKNVWTGGRHWLIEVEEYDRWIPALLGFNGFT